MASYLRKVTTAQTTQQEKSQVQHQFVQKIKGAVSWPEHFGNQIDMYRVKQNTREPLKKQVNCQVYASQKRVSTRRTQEWTQQRRPKRPTAGERLTGDVVIQTNAARPRQGAEDGCRDGSQHLNTESKSVRSSSIHRSQTVEVETARTSINGCVGKQCLTVQGILRCHKKE